MLVPISSGVQPHCRTRRSCQRPTSFVRSVHAQRSVSDTPPVTIPQLVSSTIQKANKEWLKDAFDSPLVDQQSGVRIHLAGICPYAPHQHSLIADLLSKASPTHILVEQPPDPSHEVILPYPRWLQSIWDTLGDEAVKQLAASSGNSSSSHASLLGPLSLQLQQLALPDAHVGRDIIDPFEVLGFYAGLDLLKTPQHASIALQEFHFLPGLELLQAAQFAAEHGLQYLPLDAPLKLQESWVKRIVEGFKIQEKDYAYNPTQDLDAVQTLLLADLTTWDEQLANLTAEQAMAAGASPPAAAGSSSSGSSDDISSASGPAAAAATGAGAAPPPSVEELALVRYKVSRATAAATLSPAATATALQHMARLQPLKFRHFAEREVYMAQRIREISSKAAAACGLGVPIVQNAPAATSNMTSSGSSSTNANLSRPTSEAGEGASSSSSGDSRGSSSSSSPPVVVAIVGRQHVAGIRKAWNDKQSYLWRDVMPRSFAPTAMAAEVVAD